MTPDDHFNTSDTDHGFEIEITNVDDEITTDSFDMKTAVLNNILKVVTVISFTIILVSWIKYLISKGVWHRCGGDSSSSSEEEEDDANERRIQIMNDRQEAGRIQLEFDREEIKRSMDKIYARRREIILANLRDRRMVVKKSDLDRVDDDTEYGNCNTAANGEGRVSCRDNDRSVITLPVFGRSVDNAAAANKKTHKKQRQEESSCAICLNEYNIGDVIAWSNNQKCRHVFHEECIVTWLVKGKRKCPCCRYRFLELKYFPKVNQKEKTAVTNTADNVTSSENEDGWSATHCGEE